MTPAQLKKIALSFPGALEASSYGQPAFKIEKKFFTRLRPEDDSIVWIVDSIDERDALLEMDPKTYFITDHYKNYPSVLVRLSRLNEAMLRKLLERRWRAIAPKKLIDARGGAPRPRKRKTG
ncbi:MAG: MmcQ/YjbR family DNA-binding protein [Proteobacteria bacterium]|nr:MmcQ/YjbR family DNA-binding protein [Pseudomonadota bacterium]